MQVLGAALGSGVGALFVCSIWVAFTPAFCALQCAEQFTTTAVVTFLFLSGSAPTALLSTRVYNVICRTKLPPPPPHPPPPIASERSVRDLGGFGIRSVGSAPRNNRRHCPCASPFCVLWRGLSHRCDFVHALHHARKVLGRLGFCREAEVWCVAAHGRGRRVQVTIFLPRGKALNNYSRYSRYCCMVWGWGRDGIAPHAIVFLTSC